MHTTIAIAPSQSVTPRYLSPSLGGLSSAYPVLNPKAHVDLEYDIRDISRASKQRAVVEVLKNRLINLRSLPDMISHPSAKHQSDLKTRPESLSQGKVFPSTEKIFPFPSICKFTSCDELLVRRQTCEILMKRRRWWVNLMRLL